jgi:hypothetical protein
MKPLQSYGQASPPGDTMRPKARGLAQNGGPPGWLEESIYIILQLSIIFTLPKKRKRYPKKFFVWLNSKNLAEKLCDPK